MSYEAVMRALGRVLVTSEQLNNKAVMKGLGGCQV